MSQLKRFVYVVECMPPGPVTRLGFRYSTSATEYSTSMRNLSLLLVEETLSPLPLSVERRRCERRYVASRCWTQRRQVASLSVSRTAHHNQAVAASPVVTFYNDDRTLSPLFGFLIVGHQTMHPSLFAFLIVDGERQKRHSRRLCQSGEEVGAHWRHRDCSARYATRSLRFVSSTTCVAGDLRRLPSLEGRDVSQLMQRVPLSVPLPHRRVHGESGCDRAGG